MTKIAIVGAEESKWTGEEQFHVRMMIRSILDSYSVLGVGEKHTFISGGCPKGGIDIWAETIVNKPEFSDWKKQIFKPEVEQWEDKILTKEEEFMFNRERLIGFKSRNMQIAEACDILYCFSPGIPVENWSKDVRGNVLMEDVIPNREFWNGGIWTASHAEKLGKKVVRIVVKA